MKRKELVDNFKDFLRRKAQSTAIEKSAGVDFNTQQIIKDMVELDKEGDNKLSRRGFLGKIGKKLARRQPGRLGKTYNDAHINSKFMYMGEVVTFSRLLRKDYLVAGGILGGGVTAGAGIGYVHNKLLHGEDSNKELLHDVISHGVGEGALPASAYLVARYIP